MGKAPGRYEKLGLILQNKIAAEFEVVARNLFSSRFTDRPELALLSPAGGRPSPKDGEAATIRYR